MNMCSRARHYAILGVVLAAPVAADVPDEFLSTPLAATFGAAPAMEMPRLSPDGSELIFIEQLPEGFYALSAIDFDDGLVERLLLPDADEFEVTWCEWANESLILCQLLQPRVGTRTSQRAALVLLTTDGEAPRELRLPCTISGIGSVSAAPQRFEFWSTINWLPEDSENIRTICSGTLSDVSLYSRRINSIEGERQLLSIVADGRGQARLATRTRAEREEWWSRENSQSEWQLIAETDLPLIEDPFRPVGYGQNPNDLFHLAWDSNTWSLYAMDLANGFEDRLAFTHTVIDVKSVDRLGVTDRVVAAAYLDGRPQRFYVDARVGVVNAMLSNALPEHNIEIVNESWDQNTYIALARPPGRSGDYYRVDTVSGVIERLGPQYPALADVDLASTETLRIVDPEGGQFGAHLTLPRDASGPVPVVVLPRSAVSDADLEDPQTLVQFIAASGFAVLRVDQRGSHEYGQSWTEIKNYIGWERQADDMVLAVTQLAESGAIDGSRVCMIGRDLGGQISLMTAVRHPDFLRCLITIRLQIGGTSRPADFTSKELFDARPRERVREINPPVLLIDEHRAQVTEDADDQLRRADKDVRWIEYEYATPQFRRAHNRTDMLVRIGAFLNEHLQ